MHSARGEVEVAIQRTSRPASGHAARLMQSARGVETVNWCAFCWRLHRVVET
jgi:hypothetical protein